MTRGSDRRPCFAVMAKMPPTDLERRAREVWADDLPNPEDYDDDYVEELTWEVVGGTGSWSAVIEYEPGSQGGGSEDDLARAVSREVSDLVYVLWFHKYSELVRGFLAGEEAGEVFVWPDALAAHLGFTFPDIEGYALPDGYDLAPYRCPKPSPDDRYIGS